MAHRIAFLMPLWGRLPLAELAMRRLRCLTQRWAHDYEVDPILLAVASEPEAEELAEKCGWRCIRYPNDPLSDKLNAGYRMLRSWEVDAVVGVGSDDFCSFGALLEIMYAVADKRSFFGFLDLYRVAAQDMRTVLWTGYQGNRSYHTVGPWRTLSHETLDKLDWVPYYPGLQRGLDGSMTLRLDQAWPTWRRDMRLMRMQWCDEGTAIFDFSSSNRLSSRWDEERCHPASWEQLVREAELTVEEVQAFNSLFVASQREVHGNWRVSAGLPGSAPREMRGPFPSRAEAALEMVELLGRVAPGDRVALLHGEREVVCMRKD